MILAVIISVIKRVLNVLFFSAPGRASDAHLWLITLAEKSNHGN